MLERRKFARWQIDKDAKMSLGISTDQFDCHVKDISYKGLKVVMDRVLPPSRFVEMTLDFPQNFELNIMAYVAWARAEQGRNMYGVFFSRIMDADKDRIYQYMLNSRPREVQEKLTGGTAPFESDIDRDVTAPRRQSF
jgi:c-di-GMP-binding flagellar brake protein YcgR